MSRPARWGTFTGPCRSLGAHPMLCTLPVGVGLCEGGKVESALRLPQSPHGGCPAGKQAHLCSCSNAELFCPDPIFPVSCLGAGTAPSLGTAGPALHGPAEQPSSLGFSALVFTSRARKQLSGDKTPLARLLWG